LGIDEHFFSRKQGFATTLCDLRNYSVFDVVKGCSDKEIEAYLHAVPGKEKVKVICMDIACRT
jgi:transposase